MKKIMEKLTTLLKSGDCFSEIKIKDKQATMIIIWLFLVKIPLTYI
jgi:hypothetical protein